MKTFDNFQELLATANLPELGPGPREGVESEASLNGKLEKRFQGTGLSEERRQLIWALGLLWHDHLEAANGIAQRIGNADGALVHGIMHRRDPDYSNAAYWFQRVGKHPVFPELARRVGEMLDSAKEDALREELIPKGEWDPFGFVNLCERAVNQSEEDQQTQLLRAIQKIETGVLLEWFKR